jgi:hypothetical protein
MQLLRLKAMTKMQDKIDDFNRIYRGLLKLILILGLLFQSLSLGFVGPLSFFIKLRDQIHNLLLLYTRFFQKKIGALLSIARITFHLHL